MILQMSVVTHFEHRVDQQLMCCRVKGLTRKARVRTVSLNRLTLLSVPLSFFCCAGGPPGSVEYGYGGRRKNVPFDYCFTYPLLYSRRLTVVNVCCGRSSVDVGAWPIQPVISIS